MKKKQVFNAALGWPVLQDKRRTTSWVWFSSLPNFKFFHSLFIASIFRRMHKTLNVGKK
jgi:hypothetical protein